LDKDDDKIETIEEERKVKFSPSDEWQKLEFAANDLDKISFQISNIEDKNLIPKCIAISSEPKFNDETQIIEIKDINPIDYEKTEKSQSVYFKYPFNSNLLVDIGAYDPQFIYMDSAESELPRDLRIWKNIQVGESNRLLISETRKDAYWVEIIDNKAKVKKCDLKALSG
jgi:hypothetical protein